MSENGGRSVRCPLWVKLLLVVSLVANMAVAGLYLGYMNKPKRERGTDRQISWILKFVPEARRADAEKLFESKREDIRELYRDRSKYMDEILAAIRAEPFAPETLIAAMRARRENSGARRMIIEDSVVELLSGFSAEERTEFADRMEESLKKWAERRGRK